MKRYPNGAEGDSSSRSACRRAPRLVGDGHRHVPERPHRDRAVSDRRRAPHLAVNLGCLDLNPWPVRRSDVRHPDELRVDLDPQPGVEWSAVRTVAMHVREVLAEHGMEGFPKTSGSRGIHVNVRLVAN